MGFQCHAGMAPARGLFETWGLLDRGAGSIREISTGGTHGFIEMYTIISLYERNTNLAETGCSDLEQTFELFLLRKTHE